MKRCLWSLLLCGTIVFVSCSNSVNSNGGTPSISNSVMALAVGNSWVYERQTRAHPGDPFDIDTVVIRICDVVHSPTGDWFVPCGLVEGEMWANRDDGFWVKPDGQPAYMLFRYPVDNVTQWPGADSDHTVNLHPPYGTYATIPSSGSYYSIIYYCESQVAGDDNTSYVFTPHLGIATTMTWGEDDVSGANFSKERLDLIDFQVKDPPADTTGTIGFLYHMDEDSLPDITSLRIHVDLDASPFGCMWYGFFPEWRPELPSGCYCPLRVSDLPDSATFTHYIEVPYVPSGARSIRVTLTPSGGLDTLSSVLIDSVLVSTHDTVSLGRIDAFGD